MVESASLKPSKKEDKTATCQLKNAVVVSRQSMDVIGSQPVVLEIC